jgi:prepilin-type N-terminal cleavage/methylation domain-containing protein
MTGAGAPLVQPRRPSVVTRGTKGSRPVKNLLTFARRMMTSLKTLPSMRPFRCRQALTGRAPAFGFTLVELMVTLAVAAMMLAIAVPALGVFATGRATAAQADELVSTLRFARGEAMKRSGPVTVCRLATPAAADCAGSGGAWQYWMVFAEHGNRGVFDPNELKLRVQNAGPANVHYVTQDTPAYVSFQSTGIVVSDDAAPLPLRWQFDPTFANLSSYFKRSQRFVCLNAQGRVSVVDGNSECTR